MIHISYIYSTYSTYIVTYSTYIILYIKNSLPFLLRVCCWKSWSYRCRKNLMLKLKFLHKTLVKKILRKVEPLKVPNVGCFLPFELFCWRWFFFEFKKFCYHMSFIVDVWGIIYEHNVRGHENIMHRVLIKQKMVFCIVFYRYWDNENALSPFSEKMIYFFISLPHSFSTALCFDKWESRAIRYLSENLFV